jgi:murein DD-endopeptidase MepM/ murein hydrolase activator NlpD
MILGNPLPKKVTAYRRNKTLHGRSVYRPQDVPGHNVCKGYSHPGTGDALDLFCPAGTEVRAMHSGQIGRFAEIGDTGTVIYVDGTASTVDVTTIYCHLHAKENLTLGSHITQGQVIGYVGKKVKDPHLHLEVWAGGHSISGKTARELAKKVGQMIV